MWNVFLLGLVSFFADISAEMVYPIIPLYLTSVFGATPALVGVIEGVAESLASLLKVFSGYVSDRYQKKKPIAFLGYATGLVYKAALIAAGSWVGILGARVIDRMGKGIRTAPRDVMVSDSAESSRMGAAFGLHKALDMAGSAIGILIAYVLLSSARGAFDYRNLFLISMIPAFLSLAVFPFIKEKIGKRSLKERVPFWRNMKKLPGQLKLYLLVAFLFTLGNSSNAFLLLRAKSVGFGDTSVILLYFIYNVTASLLAIPLGKRSDKVGRKRLLVSGYAVFALVYLGFAVAYNRMFMILLFVLYGIYTAMIAGVERAFIAEISPKELKGTMLGLHSTIVGIALFPASAIAGALWTAFGAAIPFLFGAGLSLAAAIILLILMKGGRQVHGVNE
jgi:MFS family permease